MDEYSKIIFAEVIDTIETYHEPKSLFNENETYKITVRSFTESNQKIYSCIPADMNIKRIPIPGEYVLIFNAVVQNSKNFNGIQEQWFYFPFACSIENSVHHNRVLEINGFNSQLDEQYIDTDGNYRTKFDTVPGTFNEKSVQRLQLYEGDLLIEGRWGNSIRLGSTIKNSTTGSYGILPNWDSKESGDPLIVISTKNPIGVDSSGFRIESNSDDSSCWLTSRQQLSSLSLHAWNGKFTAPDQYSIGSQFVASGDRVIISARTDIAVIDSKKSVVINSPDLRLGADDAAEPMVHGDVLEEILSNLIDAVATGTVGSGVISQPIALQKIENARAKLIQLTSKKYFIKKD